MTIKRREFLVAAGSALTGATTIGSNPIAVEACLTTSGRDPSSTEESHELDRGFNEAYIGAHLNQVAFPLGGIGAGMFCIEGTGTLSKFSFRHRPDLTSEPTVFAALSIKGSRPFARVLEGPVRPAKMTPNFTLPSLFKIKGASGLPRFRAASFKARFPFGTVLLTDPESPVGVTIRAWSPFVPGDEDSSSLPVAVGGVGRRPQRKGRSCMPSLA
jgi:hypothetical protein